jgi:hypothetical protein
MTDRRLVRPLALATAAAFAFAACGTSTATTAPATVSTPTEVPATQAPGFTIPPGSFAPGFSFELPSADKDLEAVLPDELAGETVRKLSMTGQAFVGSGEGAAEMEATLRALGKTPADLSVAFGSNASVVLIAFRVKDVDANVIYQAVVAAQEEKDNVITDVTVAGKPAKQVVDGIGTKAYLYLTGDALVTITGVGSGIDDALLNEIFTKLP